MAKNKIHDRRVVGPEEGRSLPGYDLLGNESLTQAVLKELNQHRRLLGQTIASLFSKSFNGVTCQVECSPFVNGVVGQLSAADSLVWVLAENEQCDMAWMAIETRQLFNLAILFFGGAVLKNDSVNVNRPLSDTELRLFSRLCQMQMNAFSSITNRMQDSWRISVIDSASLPVERKAFYSENSFALGEYKSAFHFWWSANIANETPVSVDSLSRLTVQLNQVLPVVPVHLRLKLSEFDATLGELSALKAGDVISLDLPDLVPAYIGEQQCCTGRVAEHNGAMVYQVVTVTDKL